MEQHRRTSVTDVWLLQETSPSQLRATQRDHMTNDAAYRSFMRSAWTGDQRPFIQSLVGIVVENRALEIISHRCFGDRMIRVTIKWPALARPIHIISIYAPVTVTPRRKFFREYFPLVFGGITAGDHIIIGGDWNDVADQWNDRSYQSQYYQSVWKSCVQPTLSVHSLHDVFRHLHPRSKKFSHVHFAGESRISVATRIDTALASPALLQLCSTATYTTRLGSDHHLFHCTFGQLEGAKDARGPGFWHFHSALMSHDWYPQAVKSKLVDLLQRLFTESEPQADISAWFEVMARFRSWALDSSRTPGADNNRNKNAIGRLEKALNAIVLDSPEACQTFMRVRREMRAAASLQATHDEAISHLRLQQEQRIPTLWLAQVTGDGRHFKGVRNDTHPDLSFSCEAVNTFFGALYRPSCETPHTATARHTLLHTCYGPLALTMSARAALEEQISIEEVLAAIKHVDHRSAPGPDGLPFTIYKHCALELAPFLARLANALCRPDVSLPAIHPHARGVLLWKMKGLVDDLRRYRPLSIGNADLRIISTIFASRLESAFRNVMVDMQTGFLKGRSSLDNLFVLNATVWAVREGYCDTTTLILFDQDQEKAYDRVNHDWLDIVLQAANVGENTRNFFRNIYDHPHVQFVIRGFFCAPLPILRGVLQGDASSSMLYLLVYQPFLAAVRAARIGVDLGSHSASSLLVTGTAFADNSMILLSKPEHVAKFHHIRHLYDLASDSRINEDSATYIVTRSTQSTIPSWAQEFSRSFPHSPAVTAIKHLGRPLSLDGNIPAAMFQGKLDTIRKEVAGLHSSTLHYFGRAKYANTFVLSKLWWFCEIGPIPGSLHADVHDLLKPFLWGGRRAVVESDLAYLPLRKGGLALLHTGNMLIALTGSWLARLLLAPSDQGRLCRIQLEKYCQATFGTDCSVLLARRGKRWHDERSNIARHNTSLWGRAREAIITLNLSLPRSIPWDQLMPLEAASLPLYMPGYFSDRFMADATWRKYDLLALQGGFYSFADVLYVDTAPTRSHLSWYPIAIPSVDDLYYYRHATDRTSNKSDEYFGTALAWFQVEDNFERFWEALDPQLCTLLRMAVSHSDPCPSTRPGPRPVSWPALHLPWHVTQLCGHALDKYTVRRARLSLAPTHPHVPNWLAIPSLSLSEQQWDQIWQELHRYPKLPNGARSEWWALLHNRPVVARTYTVGREHHHTPCSRSGCPAVAETALHAFAQCPHVMAIWRQLWHLGARLIGNQAKGLLPDIDTVLLPDAIILGFPSVSALLRGQARMRFRLWFLLAVHAITNERKRDIFRARTNKTDTTYSYSAASVEAEWKRLLLIFLQDAWSTSKHFYTDWIEESQLVTYHGCSFTLSF